MFFKLSDLMDEAFNIVLVGTGGQGVIVSSSILGWAALKMDNTNKVRSAETHGMAQRGGTVIVHLRFGPAVESPLVKINDADAMLSFEIVEAIRYLDFLKKDGILLINDEIVIPPILFRGQHATVNPDFCIGCGNCRINCAVNTYYQHPKAFAIINTPASTVLNGRCEILAGCTGCQRCMEICSRNAIQIIKEISYPGYIEIENKIKAVSKKGFIIPASKVAAELGDVRMANIVMIGALLGFKNVPLDLEVVKEALKIILNPKIIALNLKALEAGKELIKEYIKD